MTGSGCSCRAGCLFVSASIILATFLDYGLTYDEGVGSWYGRLVLKWYASFFKDQSALGYYDLHLYGGFFEATAQAIVSLTRKISPLGFYETRHLINALFGLLGIYYTCKLGTHIAGPRAGFFSGLFLTLTPGFYGHIFNNSKDIPFAALFSLALFCILRTYSRLPAVSYRPVLETGLAIGLVLGVRVGGIILLGLPGTLVDRLAGCSMDDRQVQRAPAVSHRSAVGASIHSNCHRSLGGDADVLAMGASSSAKKPLSGDESDSKF